MVLNVDTSYALAKLDAAVSSRIAMAHKKLVANPLNPPGLDPFDKAVLIHTYFLGKDKIPKTTALKIRAYAALYAHKVWKGYGAIPKVNGRAVDYGSWPLFKNRWVSQQVNSPKLTISIAGERLEYDFSRWTRTLTTDL